MLESEILRASRLEAAKLPGTVLWRNSTGFSDTVGISRKDLAKWAQQAPNIRADIHRALGAAGLVRYGLARGSSDLIGISNGGLFTAAECKQPGTGRLTDEQQMFIALVRARGGIAGVFTSPEELVRLIGAGR